MSKEVVSIDGAVTECLPNATFRVAVVLGESNHSILAHLSGKIRINNINILCGDRVKLEMSPYDLTKGRIVYRYKD
jgi:translation initiation factor IF-1